ncbi:MAG: hypothetical protein R6U38_17195 [Desulfatiglandaceae bacterium]
MDRTNKKDVISAIDRNAEELHQRIEMHRSLVASVLESRMDPCHPEAFLDLRPQPSREDRLKQAIMEAIDVLEESRKAFKSRRLEALRKKLTVVLIDNP